jgi:hypothetical protein
MSYVESNLLPNEQVTYWAKLHWIIYTLPAFVFAVAILVAVAGGWIAGIAIAIVGFILVLPPWIKSSSSEFAITNKRVLIKVGLIRRILGYGTITISGVGGTKEAFRVISNPLEFRRQVQASLAA